MASKTSLHVLSRSFNSTIKRARPTFLPFQSGEQPNKYAPLPEQLRGAPRRLLSALRPLLAHTRMLPASHGRRRIWQDQACSRDGAGVFKLVAGRGPVGGACSLGDLDRGAGSQSWPPWNSWARTCSRCHNHSVARRTRAISCSTTVSIKLTHARFCDAVPQSYRSWRSSTSREPRITERKRVGPVSAMSATVHRSCSKRACPAGYQRL